MGDWHSSFMGLGGSNNNHLFLLYFRVSSYLCILSLTSFMKTFLSFEEYVDYSPFSYCLFFCLGLQYSPDDDDGMSDSLLFQNNSLVIDSFLPFPSCFPSKEAGANSWLLLKLFMVGSSSLPESTSLLSPNGSTRG